MQTEGSQRRHRPNTGWQGIPGTCSSHRERSVSKSGSAGGWYDECWRTRRCESATNIHFSEHRDELTSFNKQFLQPNRINYETKHFHTHQQMINIQHYLHDQRLSVVSLLLKPMMTHSDHHNGCCCWHQLPLMLVCVVFSASSCSHVPAVRLHSQSPLVDHHHHHHMLLSIIITTHTNVCSHTTV